MMVMGGIQPPLHASLPIFFTQLTYLWLTLRQQGDGARTKALAAVARAIRADKRRKRRSRKGEEDGRTMLDGRRE